MKVMTIEVLVKIHNTIIKMIYQTWSTSWDVTHIENNSTSDYSNNEMMMNMCK